MSIYLNPIFLINFGNKMCTDPLMHVPKFDGQQAIIPITGSCKNASFLPVIFLIEASIAVTAFENLSNTDWMFPPSSMEIILKWSP